MCEPSNIKDYYSETSLPVEVAMNKNNISILNFKMVYIVGPPPPCY